MQINQSQIFIIREALTASEETLTFWGKMGVNIDDTWGARKKIKIALDLIDRKKSKDNHTLNQEVI